MDLKKQKDDIGQEMEAMLGNMSEAEELKMTYGEAQKCYLNHIEAQKKLEELEFTREMNKLKLEEEFRRQRESSSKVNKAWSVARDVFDMGIKIAGVVVMPMFVVGVAYAGDKELKLVNGRVFNMLFKKFI